MLVNVLFASCKSVGGCIAVKASAPRPQQWGPDLPFLGMPAMRTRWMAGAVAHKSG